MLPVWPLLLETVSVNMQAPSWRAHELASWHSWYDQPHPPNSLSPSFSLALTTASILGNLNHPLVIPWKIFFFTSIPRLFAHLKNTNRYASTTRMFFGSTAFWSFSLSSTLPNASRTFSHATSLTMGYRLGSLTYLRGRESRRQSDGRGLDQTNNSSIHTSGVSRGLTRRGGDVWLGHGEWNSGSMKNDVRC